MDKIIIEKANINDVLEISKLENNYPYEKYSLSQIEDMFNYDYYTIFKCLINGKIEGYICATILFEECNLLKIIVNSNYRRHGLGSRLINTLIEYCKNENVSSVYLEVRENNNIAISFYENIGFELETVRKGYYDGIDAKIYRLNI